MKNSNPPVKNTGSHKSETPVEVPTPMQKPVKTEKDNDFTREDRPTADKKNSRQDPRTEEEKERRKVEEPYAEENDEEITEEDDEEMEDDEEEKDEE